jgi:[acyl-carrier-protein] S-malonyltransferase
MSKQFAFVFPGQGSQAVGMFAAFADTGSVRQVFDEASEVLAQDLWQLVSEGPAEALSATVNTQPVMLTAGYAVYRAWLDKGGAPPAMVAGHSLGEYTALVAAGTLAFGDAVALVRFRATAMQEAVPLGTGAMAAILGLDDAKVREVCAAAAEGEVVEPVNFNAPGQIVFAGHKGAVERASAAAKQAGARRAVMLPVSAPFHSSLLKPAAEKFAAYLENVSFKSPQIPIVNNVDVATPFEPAAIKAALARQAASPVRWVEVIQRMAASGVTDIVECGPGKVLAGLTPRIESGLASHALTDPASIAQTLEALA